MGFLQSIFCLSHQDLRQTQAQTTAASDGQQANHAGVLSSDQPHLSDSEFDLVIREEAHSLEAISNLATEIVTEKSTIATLTNTNAVLEKEIAAKK